MKAGHQITNFASFSPKVIIISSIIFPLFVILTGIVYAVVENWSYTDGFYFAIISISTVGYGDVVPTTTTGKIVNIFFIICSFCGVFVLFRVVLGYLVDHQIASIIKRIKQKKKQEKKENNRWAFGFSTKPSTNLDKLADQAQQEIQDTEDAEINEGRNITWVINLIMYLCWLLLWTLFYSLSKDEDYTVFNALYSGIITSSTIGYGQFTPTSNTGKIFCLITTLLGTVFLTVLVGSLSHGIMSFMRRMCKKKGTVHTPEQKYHNQLDTLLDYAKSGKGRINKFDFVMEMLIAQDKLKRNQVKKLCLEFDKLDMNDDGVLDEKDFELYKQDTMIIFGGADDGGDVEVELVPTNQATNIVAVESPSY